MKTSNCELDQLAEELSLRREIDEDDTIRYYNDKDEWHRTNGPAAIYNNGTEIWYHRNIRHRLDGPAMVFPNVGEVWFINGKEYTKEEFNAHPDVIAYAKSKQRTRLAS